MDISRQTYYKYRNKEDKDYEEYILIKKAFEEGQELYGYRRLKKLIFEKYKIKINHKKILRLMKKYGLKVKYERIYKKNSTKQRQEKIESGNLLNRKFIAEKENEKWCTDITYLIYKNKKAYLSSILDLKNRKIIAYKIGRKNDNKLVIETLKEAQGTILHSDHGFQYTSIEYRAICQSKGIIISMSRKGTPIDNSPIESFHANLKRETLYSNNITSIEKYIELVDNWIKFYNSDRIRL